jgi:ubiquinol-cytochrome c reductase cytochrome b subunit
MLNRLSKWVDERIDLMGIRKGLLDRKMPGGLTWWHTLGSATLAVFMVQAITGTILAMYYAPSPDHAYDSIRYLEAHVASGALLRGIHHWGASVMVVLVVAHAIRVFSMGAYKYPRELNWLLGVLLLGIVLGFGFTGYLLPWDQKAYWATQVGTNIAGTTPVVGALLVKLLRGGSQLGVATLTRFYALHVLLLPAMLIGIAMLHLVMVIRQGIAPRTGVLEAGAPEKTDSPEYRAYYAEKYAASKGAGVRFWPDIIVKDSVIACLLVVVIFLLAHYVGAGLELPADPSDSSYVPRPEWYFLPFFQLLKLVPGSMESIVAVGIPGALGLALVLLPFYDRKSARALRRRPAARISLFALLGGLGLLMFASMMEPKPNAIAPEVGRVLNSPERAGRALFERQQCGGCHIVAGKGGADKKGDAKDAPDLTEVGLRHSPAYIHSFIEDPSHFHTGSKMPAFGPPVLSHQEIEELSRYLSSLRGKDWATAKEQFVDTFPEPIKPKEKK